MKHSRKYRDGFTLVELLAVLGILVLVGGVGVVAYSRIAESGRKKAAQALINDVVKGVDLYRTAVGEYPGDEDGLRALISAPDDEAAAAKWRGGGGPFLTKPEIPKDPWGSELRYVRTSEDGAEASVPFKVYSFGPNKIDDNGAEDDISSYTAPDTI